MSFYEHKADKKSGDGLALTEWNDLSSSLAGNSGLTLAKTAEDKIGIGTDQPEQKLHVKSGGLLIQSSHNDVTADIGAFFAKNLTQGIGIGYNRIEAIGSNASQHILLKPKGAGNVGIGTTSSPEEKLHVSGNIKATKFIGDGSGLTNLSVGLTGINLATANGSMVGVGTDKPASKLEIMGGNIALEGNRSIVIGSWDSNVPNPAPEAQLVLDGKHNDGFNLKTKLLIRGFDNESDVKAISVVDENSNELFFLKSQPINQGQAYFKGNVGIGLVDPGATLDVARGTASWGTAVFRGTNRHSHFNYSTNEDTYIRGGKTNSNVFLNDNGGNVGVGTGNPQDKLDVNGTLRLTGGGNFCRMFTIDKKLVFTLNNSTHGANRGMSWDGDTNWDSYSDERLKTNVSSEQNILDRLVKLDVKNYDWKGSPEKEIKMIGFIAQDVKPLFPALVGEIEDPETMQKTMTLKYASFGVLAVGAIKELKQEIDSLQQQFKNLKNGFPALD